MYNTLGGGNAPLTPRTKKERKVSVVFRHSEGSHQHCAGVESVLLIPNRKALFTASRDSTIKRWSVGGAEAKLEASFEGHSDWVNDIVLINDLLISCSNDRTLRVWKAALNEPAIHVLTHHTDYVTALAVAPASNMVASAGLRYEVFLTDIQTGQICQLYPKDRGGGQGQHLMAAEDAQAAAGACQGSVYALAMNHAGTLLAAGTTEHLVRLWDPRTNSRKGVAKLRGHTDNVRSVVISPDGTSVLSGASDGTIRLWDIGTQRCVQTYAAHSDSVWHLTTSEDFSVVYSGGRDKCVCRTNLQSRTTELLFVEKAAVRKLAYDPKESNLWVATPSSSVNMWHVPPVRPVSGGSQIDIFARRSTGVYATGAQKLRTTSGKLKAQVSEPVQTIKGMPGIVQHKVLSDRRHVLTKDSAGCVALWDVLAGRIVESFGNVDYEAKEVELFEAKSVPAWFSSDNRLGQLCITLEPPSCFLAEEYAVMLDYPNVSEDYKVNYGKLVLDGAFAMWRYQRRRLENHQEDFMQGRSLSATQQSPVSPGSPGQALGPAGSAAGPMLSASSEGNMEDMNQVYRELWPQYWLCRAVPAVLSSYATGERWRLVADQFRGTETAPHDIPSWVDDVVIREIIVTPKEGKCAFILLPAEGTNLPQLMQSKLNAPRILQIHKVANYAITKLVEQNVHLEIVPRYLKRPPNVPLESPTPSGKQVLELSCNGVALPYEMSLASVKKWIWRRQDTDLVFHYKIMDPNNPIPLPKLSPGG